MTWPTISAGSRLRTSRIVPVWQKRQLSVQPTWLDTHKVPRSASGMKTISKSWPSWVLQQPFAGAVGRHLRLDHLGPRDDEALGEPGALRLGDVAHRVEIADAAIVDPVPDLLGAQLRLPAARARPPRARRGSRPCGRPTSSTRPSARAAAPALARARGRRCRESASSGCRRSWQSRLSSGDQRILPAREARSAPPPVDRGRRAASSKRSVKRPPAPIARCRPSSPPRRAQRVDDRLVLRAFRGSTRRARARRAGTAGRRSRASRSIPARGAPARAEHGTAPQRRRSGVKRKPAIACAWPLAAIAGERAQRLAARCRGRSPPSRPTRQRPCRRGHGQRKAGATIASIDHWLARDRAPRPIAPQLQPIWRVNHPNLLFTVACASFAALGTLFDSSGGAIVVRVSHRHFARSV